MSYAQAVELHAMAIAEADAAAVEYRAARAAFKRSRTQARLDAFHAADAELERLSTKARELQTACEREAVREAKAVKAEERHNAGANQLGLFDPVQIDLFG